MIEDIEGGYLHDIIAFVIPATGFAWPLPVYELALMTASRAREINIGRLAVTIVTSEDDPLAVFGRTARAQRCRPTASRPTASRRSPHPATEGPDPRRVVINPGDRHPRLSTVWLRCPQLIAAPRRSGCFKARIHAAFIPVDEHSKVRGGRTGLRSRRRDRLPGQARRPRRAAGRHGGARRSQRWPESTIDPKPLDAVIRGHPADRCREPRYVYTAQLIAGHGYRVRDHRHPDLVAADQDRGSIPSPPYLESRDRAAVR